MKNIITLAMVSLLVFNGFSQNKNKEGVIKKNQKGIITSVKFSAGMEKSKIPSSATAFFEEYLEANPSDQFEKEEHKSKRKEYVHDHYDQYYKGVKVDGAGYNLHYKNGRMYFANGNYVRVANLSATPSVSLKQAIEAFLRFKGIAKEKVANTITELLVKEIGTPSDRDTVTMVNLVYRIYLEADHPNNDEVGYVDAHTGKVILTEPRLTHATGTFATRYSGSRQSETDPIPGGHRLFDNTRGATIHTLNLQNNTTILSNAVEVVDNDNIWTAAEHATNNNDMGLDVHWELQEIYDHLNVVHGINSFDDSGQAINAYVRYGDDNNERDNAFWNPTLNVLLFGQGVTRFSPLASIDVVAHEFGHGITDFQIGWNSTGDQRALNEGMSDIWAAILEQRIRPSSTWQIGEQITLTASSLRNIQNTNDTNAQTQIADTFESTQYNNSTSIYVRSGVFSHWFYILANGETGTNDVSDSYSVDGIGLNLAEELIVETVFNNYLDGTTSYPAVRTAIINAAEAIFCENSREVKAVTDAWHAVGVGNAYQGNFITISGSSPICASGSSFTVNNLPPGATINWSSSSNITRNSSQASNPCTFSSSSSGNGWIQATITLSGTCANNVVVREDVSLGTSPVDIVTFANSYNGEEYLCTSHYGNMYQISPHVSNTTYQYRLRRYPNLNVVYTSPIGQSDTGTINYIPPQGWYEFQVRTTNSCGTGLWAGYEVEYIDCSLGSGGEMYSVYPNPASSEVNITFKTNKTTAKTRSQSLNSQQTTEIAKLFDFNGAFVRDIELDPYGTTKMDVSNLKEGLYFLKIQAREQEETYKIIVAH